MDGPANGDGMISLTWRHGDPAGNEKAVAWFDELVTRLQGERSPADGNLSSGTLFPGFGSNPVRGSLTVNYTNDDGKTFTVTRSVSDVGKRPAPDLAS